MRKPLLIALLATVSLSPAALARDYDTLDEFEKFTRTYMATNIGLEPMDYELFVRGEAQLGERQPIQALAIFAKLAETYPNHPTLQLFMGRAYLQLNQLAEAQGALEKPNPCSTATAHRVRFFRPISFWPRPSCA